MKIITHKLPRHIASILGDKVLTEVKDEKEFIALLKYTDCIGITERGCEENITTLKGMPGGNKNPVLLLSGDKSKCWECTHRYSCVDRVRGSVLASELTSRLRGYLPIAKLIEGCR